MATTPILSIPQRSFAAGEFVSPSFTVPQGLPTFSLAVTVDSTGVTDPAQFLTITVERQDPVSKNWVFDHQLVWQGGGISSATGLPVHPSVAVDVGPLAGQTCRFRMNCSKSITLSAVVKMNSAAL